MSEWRSELLTCILGDKEHYKGDAVYLFSQTSDNQRSVLEAGYSLWRRGRVSKIALCDGETEHGYPGYEAWRKELMRLGTLPYVIEPVPFVGNVNTLSESEALVRHAKESGWQRIYVSGALFDHLRCFMTAVSSALRADPITPLKIYSCPGVMLPWKEYVRHSQGTLVASRLQLISIGFGKIEEYQRKGDILPNIEILSYLLERDYDESNL
jgi:hypothetical protein